MSNITPVLKDIVARIERLEQEKQAIADDIKQVYAEAKSSGFDAKVLRRVIQLRKMDPKKREEMEDLTDVYMHALSEDLA